jgi:hypothetical protein
MIVDVYDNDRIDDQNFLRYAPIINQLAAMGVQNSRQYLESVAHDINRMLFK